MLKKTEETGGAKHDFRRVESAKRILMLRVAGIGLVLYLLCETVAAYRQGGPDAPGLGVLIAAVILLGGGAVLIGWLSWRTWKREKAAARMTEEEIRQVEALRAESEE